MLGRSMLLAATNSTDSTNYALTDASLLYSLRNLYGYDGRIVVARRSSDNTLHTFTSSEITNGTLTSWVGSGNGFVHTWYNQVSNTNHMIQATNANQPQIVENGSLITRNGVPTLKVTSSSILMEISTTLNLTRAQSIYAALYLPSTITAATPAQSVWRSTLTSVDGFGFGAQTGSLTNERLAWITVSSSTPYGHGMLSDIAAGSHVFSALLGNTGNPLIRIDSVSRTLVAAAFGGFTSTIYPRGFTRIMGGFVGEFSEIQVYNAIFHDSTQYSEIETDITNYYGI